MTINISLSKECCAMNIIKINPTPCIGYFFKIQIIGYCLLFHKKIFLISLLLSMELRMYNDRNALPLYVRTKCNRCLFGEAGVGRN